MSQINPFAGAIAATPQAQRLASADRDAQVRRTQQARTTTGHPDHPADAYVEGADAIAGVHDDGEHGDPREKKRKHPHDESPDESAENDPPPHIDIRA